MDTRIPTHEIRWLVNRYHVSVPTERIGREIARRARENRWPPECIEQARKYAEQVHQENRELFFNVVGGRF